MMDDVEAMDLVSGAAADCPCLKGETDCTAAACYHKTGEGACRNCDGSGVRPETQIRIAYVQGLKAAKNLVDTNSRESGAIQREIDRAVDF